MSDLVRVRGKRNSTWLRKGQTRLAPYTPELQLLADAGWVEILDPPPSETLSEPPGSPETNVLVFACDWCGRQYKTERGLAAHQEIPHGTGE